MSQRVERDTMGEMLVPEEALYGAQTARAVENFPISGARHRPRDDPRAGPDQARRGRGQPGAGPARRRAWPRRSRAAAQEVVDGKLDEHFPVDVFQTGSGTSSNMNANEVIANRAIQLLGGEVGSKDPVHPNDHVNLGQSSNDVFPTAHPRGGGDARWSCGCCRRWTSCSGALRDKAAAFDDDRQDRPHAPAGRHAHPAGAGVLGLRGPGGARRGPPRRGAAPTCASWPRAAPRWAPGSTRTPSSAAAWRSELCELTGVHFRRGGQPLRGPGGPGRRGAGQRRAQDPRRGADQDRQRPPLARLGAAPGPGRAADPGGAAGLEHHARQGQPGDRRVADHGLRPGHRQRRGRSPWAGSTAASSSTPCCR